MRLGNFLSLAVVPMLVWACSENGPDNFGPDPKSENPEETPQETIPENTPDELLKPIDRDSVFSEIWKGDGSAEKPYLVSSEEQLLKLAFYVNDSSMNFRDKYFKQTADIELKTAWSPIGIFGSNPNGYGNRPFSGSFDGDNKIITGLTINNDTASYTGLFGLTRGAKVSNVVLKNVKMTVGARAGALAGKMDSSAVENCSVVDAEITGLERVGGLVGEGTHITITTSTVTGKVSGTNTVGGVIGSLQDGSMETVANAAVVSGSSVVGGIAGALVKAGTDCSVSLVINSGAVTGTQNVGGIVANLSACNLEKAGNIAAVTGGENQMAAVGGVAANASKSVVNEAYNTGAVTVTKVASVGGVFGKMSNTSATNVFNHGEIAGATNNKGLGGIVGIFDGESKLESAYNKGVIPNENYAGAVAGKVTSTVTVANVFYDKTIAGTSLVFAEVMSVEEPTGMTSEEMQTSAFAATLNGTGSVWTVDPAKFGGYPSFSWAK